MGLSRLRYHHILLTMPLVTLYESLNAQAFSISSREDETLLSTTMMNLPATLWV